MDRIFDKIIILLICVATLTSAYFSPFMVAAFLAAIIIAFISEIGFSFERVSTVGAGLYLIMVFFIPEFTFFIPLVVYDYMRKKSWFFRSVWIVPFIYGLCFFAFPNFMLTSACALIMIFLAFRTIHAEHKLLSSSTLRDQLREESFILEAKNRDLRERQDIQIYKAILSERGRIAREIHDNVGHLLTRLVLQIEAYRVVHGEEDHIQKEFQELGVTAHEALDTVRKSVHDLHEDSFDLKAQLEAATQISQELEIRLVYHVDYVPSTIGHCFIALTREALSNTLKHSNANTFSITALEQPGFYRLSLQDNGSFVQTNVSEALPYKMGHTHTPDFLQRGIGLYTMEERVRELKGVFRVDYSNGFRIVASIPKKKQVNYEQK